MSSFSSPSDLTLKYWNGRGLMEVPRLLLAIAGKFPTTDYTDGRFSAPADGLEMNLGRMPVLSTPDGSVGQSVAINFYVATTNNLMGSSPLDAARILSVTAHVSEMMDAFRKIVPYGATPTEEDMVKWFDTGATDSTGAADGSKRPERFAQWWVGRIEASLDASGYAIGSSISLADVVLYNAFAEVLREEERGEGFAAWRAEPMCSLARTNKLLESAPKLSGAIDKVREHAGTKKWLSMRGVQYF
jgi:glutathione S-transferase